MFVFTVCAEVCIMDVFLCYALSRGVFLYWVLLSVRIVVFGFVKWAFFCFMCFAEACFGVSLC